MAALIRILIAAAAVFPVVEPSFIMSAYSADGGIILHYPPDNVVMEFGLVNISMSLPDGSADIIEVRNNNEKVAGIVPGPGFECFSVPIKPGVNKIQISVLRNGKKVYDKSLSVFRRSDLESKYREPPAGFRKDYFHMRDNVQCRECHVLEARESDKKPVNPESFIVQAFDEKAVISATSTCYSCHKEIASAPYVHGPVAVWSCVSCHDADSEPKYSVKKPDAEVCFGCHREQKNNWAAKKYTHGPVTIGKCAICHSPHSADYPFNLYKSTWDLCVNCHAEKGSGKHVLGDSFSTEGHPTRDRPDPLRNGKELSCASCHDPHASNYPHLWAFEVQTIFELCKKCHYDK